MNFRFTLSVLVVLIFSLNTCLGDEITWVKRHAGEPVPTNAIKAGKDSNTSSINEGKDLYVCRAAHAGETFAGKLLNGQCNIAYNKHEEVVPDYEVAVGRGTWRSPSPGNVGAVQFLNHPGGYTVYVCRMPINGFPMGHGVQPGKLVNGTCYVPWGNQEYSATGGYEVLYAGDAPYSQQSVAIADFTIAPSETTAGTPIRFCVRLNHPAPAGGFAVGFSYITNSGLTDTLPELLQSMRFDPGVPSFCRTLQTQRATTETTRFVVTAFSGAKSVSRNLVVH